MAPQHFLKSATACDLPLGAVLSMREEQACRWFYRARWGGGPSWCPHCGAEGAYALSHDGKRRNRFKCRQRRCRREFTATSGTVFASASAGARNLPAPQILSGLPTTAHTEASFLSRLPFFSTPDRLPQCLLRSELTTSGWP